jgi:hypothetical protein
MGECSTNPLLAFRLSLMSTAAPSLIDLHTLLPISVALSGADRFANRGAMHPLQFAVDHNGHIMD